MPGLFTLFSGFSMVADAQQSVKGYVYVDQNNNGKKDRKEKGLAGVGISNGNSIVQTEKDGSYMISVEKDNIIFIIKPAGYESPLSKDNTPTSYYIYKPEGAPKGLKYAGSGPTKLPAELNFALKQVDEPEDFSVLVFGDPQPYNDEELQYFKKSVVDVIPHPANAYRFGLSLGDLVGNNLSLHPAYKSTVAALGIPWYNVMGNHDMNQDVKEDSLSDETFEMNFGPANYSMNYGNTHFIILDDILFPDPRDGKGYLGGLREDQFDFLENDLKLVDPSKLVVVAFHIPLQDETGAAFRRKDRQRIFDLLEKYPHCLLTSAHTHYQEQIFYTKKNGWNGAAPLHEYNVGTTSGDWYSGKLVNGAPDRTMRDGTPAGYAVLNIKGDGYDLAYHPVGAHKDLQIGIYAPKIVPKDKNSSALIYANFFMGGEKDQVLYRVDQGKWQPMSYVATIDPNYFKTLIEWDNSDQLIEGRRPSNPTRSTHLWNAPVPAKLSQGNHTIEVKATDMFGNNFTNKRGYEVRQRP